MNTESPFLNKPVALIAGPTASGKSALAVALAAHSNGVVINADASQVYRDLRIISARPSSAEEQATEHQLFGHIDGAESCSAAQWAAEARAAIADVHAQDRLPILVGGTGLYLRTLLDGIAPVPDINPEIRTRARALPVTEAYAALAMLDPEAAGRLNPADTTRIARALEVIQSTGRPLTEWQKDRVGGISTDIHLVAATLLPPREWLNARCDTRFIAMLDQGGIGEVEALLARRLDPALPVMRAIGVSAVTALIKGDLSRSAAIESGQIATRQYAKRQYTWFRNQPPPDWMRIDTTLDNDAVNNLAIKLRNMALTV